MNISIYTGQLPNVMPYTLHVSNTNISQLIPNQLVRFAH